jgi:GNAT superfamily N-acetyltransferase
MIRPARPDDVPTILVLIRELARYEKLEHEVVGTEAALHAHLFGPQPRAEVLLVEDGGDVRRPDRREGTDAKADVRRPDRREGADANTDVRRPDRREGADANTDVVAFALFFHNYSTFLCRPGLYLEDLFVLPSHRRRGHGRALLVALARLAIERGCGRFEWAALAWNEPALAFYRSLGAELMSEWRIFRVTGAPLERLATLDQAGHVTCP